MKSLFKLSILLVLCVLNVNCSTTSVTPSNEITVETYNFTGYTSIDVSSDFNVVINQNDGPEEIVMEANANLQNKISISENNGTLRIKFRENINIRGNETLNVYINTNTSITNYKGSSDAVFNLETSLVAETVSINLSSDSVFKGSLDVQTMTLNASSDAKVDIFGTIDILDASLSSDAVIEDYDLMVNHLVIHLSSDSKGFITATETLDATVTSDAVLRYKGNPQIIKQVTSGDGRIINAN